MIVNTTGSLRATSTKSECNWN